MSITLTDAQAETLEELWSNGYGSFGFLPHEQFTERDNRANGARRSMNALITKGLIVKDNNSTDGRGNHYYKILPTAADVYQEWQRKRSEQERKQWQKRRASGVVVTEDW